MMGLPCGEEIMIVGRTMWSQSTSVTDRQTDGRTDGRTDRITITDTVQTASHGKNSLINARDVSFFSPPNLRAPSADRRETLPHDRNLCKFYKLT